MRYATVVEKTVGNYSACVPELPGCVATGPTVAAVLREGRDPIQASLVKDTIKRKQPSFTEADYGYRSFTDLLEDAKNHKLIVLREDPRSGTYLVNLVKAPVGRAKR